MFYRVGEKENSTLELVYKWCTVKRPVDEWWPYGVDNSGNICHRSQPCSDSRLVPVTFSGTSGPRGPHHEYSLLNMLEGCGDGNKLMLCIQEIESVHHLQ